MIFIAILQTMQATQSLPVIDEREHCRLPVYRLSRAGQAFEEGEFPTAQEQLERAAAVQHSHAHKNHGTVVKVSA
jgi:hypothetical protein